MTHPDQIQKAAVVGTTRPSMTHQKSGDPQNLAQKERTVVQGALSIAGLQAMPGYRFGLAQPCLMAKIAVRTGWAAEPDFVQAFSTQMAQMLPERYGETLKLSQAQLVSTLLNLVVRLAGGMQDSVGLPVVSPGQVLSLRTAKEQGSEGSDEWLLVLPSFVPRAAEMALRELIRLVLALDQNGITEGLPNEELVQFNGVLDQVARLAPPGTNTHRLLRTALQRGVPTLSLPGGAWQFGWGRKSRVFKSSLSDTTSAIGTAWAKNKIQTNQLLHMAGLPVPEQVLVRDLEMALREARRIGFPVVLKPADLDQGLGVEAGLLDETELKAAFKRVSTRRRRILLEKHIDGQDVRINVVHGKFHDAIARYPAGVTGDGVSSIGQLITQTNKDPRRSERRFADMRPISLNEEARELLQAQGLCEDAIPELNQFVWLRRAANVSSGGHTKGVSDDLHPDNARLSEQVAKLLRLDIAGIDLLIPDHTRSWREVGGAICEVNAQPQVGLTYPHIFDHLFDIFLLGQGRIPIVYVLVDAPQDVIELKADVINQSSAEGLRVVLDFADTQVDDPSTGRHAVRAALVDPDCSGVVILSDGSQLGKSGLPVDQTDQVWVANWKGDLSTLQRRLGMIMPHSSSDNVILSANVEPQALSTGLPGTIKFKVMDRGSALNDIQRLLSAGLGEVAPC